MHTKPLQKKTYTNKPLTITISNSSKCLITGAHSILKGHLAIAAPIKKLNLNLSFTPSRKIYYLEFSGIKDTHAEKVFIDFFKYALQCINLQWKDFPGIIKIHNTIPIRQGLGSSAALSLAIAKLFTQLKLTNTSQDTISLAKKLENFFHGSSSGIDIHAIETKNEHILFAKQGRFNTQKILYKPFLAISPSKMQSDTKKAIYQQQQWEGKNKLLAQTTHLKMSLSSNLIKKALLTPPTKRSIICIQQALELSNQCYKQWNLSPSKVIESQKKLHSFGALSSTPTGSGNGGYILSLWPKKPEITKMLDLELIPVF